MQGVESAQHLVERPGSLHVRLDARPEAIVIKYVPLHTQPTLSVTLGVTPVLWCNPLHPYYTLLSECNGSVMPQMSVMSKECNRSVINTRG